MDFFELDIGKTYIQEAKQNSWGRFVEDINKISLKNLYLFCFSLD